MEHDAWFFVGLFVFIFLMWIIIGGPTHPLSFTGPVLPQPQELGGGTYLQLPRANFGLGRAGNVVLPGSSNGQAVSGSYYSGTVPPAPTGTVFGLASPYRNLVTMSHYVSNASSSDPKSEYVQISLAQNASAGVDITGWILESDATGNAELIPKGTRVPASGVVNAADDIKLQPGESAIIISGESPVGASFEENKCIGFFGAFQQFSPPLPQNCPLPSNELSTYYGTPYIHDPSCIDYVDTLPRCQVAISGIDNLTKSCQDFLETHFNYNGCISYHQNDPDFSGNTWRVYLGRDTPMWRARHEIVKLLDKTGKTVDVFGY